MAGGTPPAAIRERRCNHNLCHRVDKRGLLHLRDEAAWRHHAALRMLPAQKRLRSGDLAGGERDLRLMPDLQLIARNGVGQTTEEDQVVAAGAVIGTV